MNALCLRRAAMGRGRRQPCGDCRRVWNTRERTDSSSSYVRKCTARHFRIAHHRSGDEWQCGYDKDKDNPQHLTSPALSSSNGFEAERVLPLVAHNSVFPSERRRPDRIADRTATCSARWRHRRAGQAMLPTILMRESPQGYFRFGGERYIYTTRPIFLPPTWLRAL